MDRANLLANPLLTHPALRPAWGASAERSAWMSVALPQLTPAERASLQSGMPAVVTLGKEQAAIGWHNMFHSAAALTR